MYSTLGAGLLLFLYTSLRKGRISASNLTCCFVAINEDIVNTFFIFSLAAPVFRISSLATKMAWGGKRHSKKPYVDVGVLTKELSDHVDLVKDLGGYEVASRTQSPDAMALLSIKPVIESLLKLSPTAEMHGKSMRNALTQLLVDKPDINTSKFNGRVWVNLRAERLTTVLSHVRELARDEASLNRTAMVLTKTDFLQLKQLIGKVQLCDAGKQSSAIVEVVSKDAHQDDDVQHKRALKSQVSNCSNMSVDSDGFPKMLMSPCKEDPIPDEVVSPPSFLRRMGTRAAPKQEVSSSSWEKTDAMPSLQAALGYDRKPTDKAKMQKKSKASPKANALPKAVSGSLSKGKHASLPKDAAGGTVRKPWLKLKKTIGKNPPKSYICGSHDHSGKVHLIVEVSEKRSSQYLLIIDHIMDKLKSDHLTKEEAIELRYTLCEEHP